MISHSKLYTLFFVGALSFSHQLCGMDSEPQDTGDEEVIMLEADTSEETGAEIEEQVNDVICKLQCLTFKEDPITQDDEQFALFIVPLILKRDRNTVTDLTPEQKEELAHKIIYVIDNLGEKVLSSDTIFMLHETLQKSTLDATVKSNFKKHLISINDSAGMPKSVLKAIKIEMLKKFSERFEKMSNRDQKSISEYGLNLELLEALDCPASSLSKKLMAVSNQDSPSAAKKNIATAIPVVIGGYMIAFMCVWIVFIATESTSQFGASFGYAAIIWSTGLGGLIWRNVYIHNQKKLI